MQHRLPTPLWPISDARVPDPALPCLAITAMDDAKDWRHSSSLTTTSLPAIDRMPAAHVPCRRCVLLVFRGQIADQKWSMHVHLRPSPHLTDPWSHPCPGELVRMRVGGGSRHPGRQPSDRSPTNDLSYLTATLIEGVRPGHVRDDQASSPWPSRMRPARKEPNPC
jgi:hypothetical protein